MTSPINNHYRIQVSTASISLTASVVLLSMILFTPKRLSTPYRRLISGMSVFDIIQSIGLLTGPYAVPSELKKSAPWAMGNTATCEANGFFSLLGTVAVPIYTLALSVRYHCRLNLKMEDKVFSNRVEKWFHLSIILVIIICFIALGMDTYNPLPSGSFCYVEEFPFLCRDYPQFVGECQRGEGSTTLSAIVTGIMILCFLGIIVNVSMLISKSFAIEQMYRSRAGDPQHLVDYSCVRDYMFCVPCRNYNQFAHEPDADYVLRLYKKETVIQSIFYVGAFFACYTFPVMQTIGSFFNYKFPEPFLYIISFFYPLGGLFNVLTYTRPKVVRLLHAFPDLSRLKAFLLVMKAGGELPNVGTDPYALELCHCCSKQSEGKRRTIEQSPASPSPASVDENNNIFVMVSMSD